MKTQNLFAFAVAACFACTPALAKKPDGAGQGHGNPHQETGATEKHGSDAGKEHGKSVHFADKDRDLIRDYFGSEFKRGNCPPGLAKKHNGCLPPGQAKKWALGKKLPGDVVFYDLPRELLKKLGVIPRGHKYVRVGSDVLLMDTATRVIVDAIENL